MMQSGHHKLNKKLGRFVISLKIGEQCLGGVVKEVVSSPHATKKTGVMGVGSNPAKYRVLFLKSKKLGRFF
jgi:hypothetical protein